jgi:spermidine dehydrogenase
VAPVPNSDRNAIDRDLGMDRGITRRDFLNGASLAIGAGMLSTLGACASPGAGLGLEAGAPDYPPLRTGLRGSHPGSFEAAHAMRSGTRFERAEDTGERYDLVVVGGGLSGLSAAYFFRKELPRATVLVLDNHDDFGGHAKRNEFVVDGRQLIGYGGTQYISGPYTVAGRALLDDVGVDPARYHRAAKPTLELYRELGLGRAVFFDRETFGRDHLAVGEPRWGPEEKGPPDTRSWRAFLAGAPLSERAQRDIARLYEEERDYLPGLSAGEKISRLRKLSYRDYLLDVAKVDPEVVTYFLHGLDSNAAGTIDGYSAWGAFRSGWLPGMQGLGLGWPARGYIGEAENPLEAIHFPDGNAGVARLIVRWLIPQALPGSSMEDSVATRVRYDALDRPGGAVRIRLESTVVGVAHAGERRSARGVDVTYLRKGRAYRASAGACVLACYNAMIPYLCPELPEPQRRALHLAVRKPYVYTSVLVSDWKAFERLGISDVSCPGAYYRSLALDWGVDLGDYRCAHSPEEPMLLHLTRVPVAPGQPPRAQFRAGREELLITPFETFERSTRDLLARVLGPGGFDPARDVRAITVNRWPHGYAGGANELFDPDWAYDEVPWVVGRRRFGRIAIANSDAAAVCLTSAAFAQGHRAVQELLNDVIRPEFQYPWSEWT